MCCQPPAGHVAGAFTPLGALAGRWTPAQYAQYRSSRPSRAQNRYRPVMYRGSCHCGKVAFEVDGDLEKLVACNCSICSKRGALHWFVPRSSFRLLTHERDVATYTFNKRKIEHRYCPDCGCAPYSEGVAPSGDYMIAVNARCLDEVDLSSIEVGHFDGRNL